MAPLPKKRCPKAHQGNRRSHQALKAPNLVLCSQCHSPKLNHRACPTCGMYAGREVLKIKAEKK